MCIRDSLFPADSRRHRRIRPDPRSCRAEQVGRINQGLGRQEVKRQTNFTGVASALDELLESHASAHRQLDTILLERLDYQPRLEIIKEALGAF